MGHPTGDHDTVGLVGQLEQEARDPSHHVEQHERADLVVGPAQALGQRAQQTERNARVRLEGVLEILPAQYQQVGVLHGDHVGRAGLVVDQGHLAEEVALTQDGKDHLSSVLADEHDLHLPSHHDVQCVTRVVLEQNNRVLRVGALACRFGHTGQLGLSQSGEERNPVQSVGYGHRYRFMNENRDWASLEYAATEVLSIRHPLARLPPSEGASYIVRRGMPADKLRTGADPVILKA